MKLFSLIAIVVGHDMRLLSSTLLGRRDALRAGSRDYVNQISRWVIRKGTINQKMAVIGHVTNQKRRNGRNSLTELRRGLFLKYNKEILSNNQ